MNDSQTISKLIASYNSEGFTSMQAGEEMSKNNTPYDIAVKVMAGLPRK
jgi:hypothetical protein